MSEETVIENPQTVQDQPEPISIQVPQDVAIQIKLLEYDKAIADAEAQVASIKQQRMAFVYDMNIKAVQAKFQAPAAPEAAKPEEN